jgi:hypothetical protein
MSWDIIIELMRIDVLSSAFGENLAQCSFKLNRRNVSEDLSGNLHFGCILEEWVMLIRIWEKFTYY